MLFGIPGCWTIHTYCQSRERMDKFVKKRCFKQYIINEWNSKRFFRKLFKYDYFGAFPTLKCKVLGGYGDSWKQKAFLHFIGYSWKSSKFGPINSNLALNMWALYFARKTLDGNTIKCISCLYIHYLTLFSFLS